MQIKNAIAKVKPLFKLSLLFESPNLRKVLMKDSMMGHPSSLNKKIREQLTLSSPLGQKFG